VTPEVVKERGQQIIRIAVEEFLEHGFDRASLEVIAKRCRVGKMTIYRQFGNKEQLFRLAVEESLSNFRSSLEHVLRHAYSFESVVRSVVRLVVTVKNGGQAADILTLGISEKKRFPQLAHMFLEPITSLRDTFADYLKSAASRLSESQARKLAMHLMDMAVGGFAFMLTEPKTYFGDDDEWVDSVTRLFVDAFERWR
jgi:AcrR family transcriptional regulator